jgi:hypothetical protein
MKLILAIFWFLVGISILAVVIFTDRLDKSINVFGGRFSPGWMAGFAFFLGLFNLVRWGLERAARSQNRQADADWAEHVRRRIRQARTEKPEEEAEPNPDFDFKKPANET